MIPPQHWATLQPYLDQALDADASARAALLDQLQAQDPALAAELRELLGDHAALQGDDFLGGAAHAGLLAAPLAGQRLGAWRLLQPIGEGGMGTVWLAQRDDGRFDAQAAVKLLNLSLTGGSAAERFRREGQFLARLAHPHIARLLDAGVTGSGQPYLVMEHVRGLRIDEHCHARRLDVGQRLRLFIALLEAVAHAHRHLVVHRDIKPANVLVTEEAGEVKLLDFGIAKLVAADETDAALAAGADAAHPLTQRADTLLTPGWAAPEQVRGDAITTATDVYALGVMLFVLLAGQHPLLRPGVSWPEVLRSGAAEEALPRLSSCVATDGLPGLPAARLRRLLRGDLDHIVAKALQPEPHARYANAAELADDLQRHLTQRPVRANADRWAPGWAYPVGRLLRRQRVPLAGLGLGLLVAAGFGIQAWQQQQAARLNEARAKGVDGLLQSLFAGMSPDLAATRQFSARELLDRAQTYLSSEQLLDADTRRSAAQRMAQLYLDIGAHEPAVAHWRAEVAAAQGGEPRPLAMALWRLADSQLRGREYEAVEASLQQLSRTVSQHLSADAEMNARLALLTAELDVNRGRVPQAEAGYRQAQDLLKAGGVQDLELRARAALGHGQAARYSGHMAAARESLQRALELNQARGAQATVEHMHAQAQLGAVESWAGRPRPAVELLSRAHAGLLPRLGPEHQLTVSAVNELAWAHIRLGEFGAARQRLLQLQGGSGPENAWRTPHAQLLEARMQLYSGQAAAALPRLRLLLTDIEQREGGTTSRTEQVRRILAEGLLRDGQTAAARALLQVTHDRQLALSSPTHTSVATTQVLLGCALARLGELDLARQHWAGAQQALGASLGPDHPFTLVAAAYLALAGASAGQDSRAEQREALATAISSQLAWQDGAAALVAWLRQAPPPVPQQRPWAQLPVLL